MLLAKASAAAVEESKRWLGMTRPKMVTLHGSEGSGSFSFCHHCATGSWIWARCASRESVGTEQGRGGVTGALIAVKFEVTVWLTDVVAPGVTD